MTPVELVALAASTSLLAGWRLYLVTLVTGLAMKFGFIALPDQLQGLDVLASNWVLAAAGVGTFAEFFADKIAWVDSAWDAIHGVIRPLGGALLSLAIVDSGDTGWQIASFLLGGGAAFPAGAALGYGFAAASAVVWASYSVLARRFARVPSGAVAGFCGATAVLAGAMHGATGAWVTPGLAAWAAMAALMQEGQRSATRRPAAGLPLSVPVAQAGGARHV